MGWRRLAALSLLATGSWQLEAGGWQQQAPPQTFRSGTQIVQVDVRVFKGGHFVTDLGPSDFTIKEDGVPQQIDSVVLIGSTPAPAAPAAPAPTAPAAPSAPAPAAPSAPSAPSAPALWVFVFDTEHLSPGGLNRAREAIVKFIGDRFRPGDVGGIVFDGKMANNRLTSNHEELKIAAAAIKMPGNLRSRQLEMIREWPRFQDEYEVVRIAADNDRDLMQRVAVRACNDDPDACRRVAPEITQKANRLYSDIRRATMNTLAAIEALANGLARIPGPKTIVFVSEGFVADHFEAALRQAIGGAARAGAHFYTLDVRGLNKGAVATLMDQPYVDNGAGPTVHFDMQSDGTNSLAVDTGGFAIRNENNFGRALDQIQQDSGTYYVVSYTATNGNFDGKYRTIDVSVDRPGVKVRARRGYLAVDPASLLKPVPATRPPARAVATPDLPVSPGLIALPEVAVPGDAGATIVGASPTRDAVRARVDGGKMTAALGRSSSSSGGPAETGWAAYEKGDVVTAAKYLADAAAAADARPWVHYALGLAEFAQQHYEAASTAWERVLRDAPQFEPIYFSLADAYGLQHDEGAALKVLREAARRWPSDPEVDNAIGVMQVKRGAIDAAIESFDAATKVAPGDALGWFNLGRTLQMRWVKSQRYDRARERWIGPDGDRKRAAEAYQRCLDIGGPYDQQARQALSALAWK